MISKFSPSQFLPNFKELITTPGLSAGRFLTWLLALTLLSPVLFVLWGLITNQRGESWSHVQNHLLGPAVSNSLILVLGVGLLALLFGVPAAWCISHYRFPGRRIFSILLILPLAVPPYIAAYISTDAREAITPLLISIRENYGVDAYLRAEVIHRFAWLILMMASVLFPYLYLASRAVFAGSARGLSEASRVLGASPWRTFRTIELPMVRPALIAGLFLVSMEVLSDYGAAKHLGINTLTVIIFRTWFGLDELQTARYLSGWVLLGIFLLLALERWQRGRARFSNQRTHRHSLQPCSAGKALLCQLACGLPVLLGFLFPILVLIRWHFTSNESTPLAEYQQQIFQTLQIAGLVTVSCLLIALLLLAVTRFSQRKKDTLILNSVFTAGYASPGTVMAVGVLGVAAILRSIFPSEHFLGPLLFSGSLLWLAFALTARYLTVAGQILSAAYQTIPTSYDHAARTLGRKFGAIFRTVHLPLLRTPLLGALVLVFVDVTKELPLTLLLRPFDFETLGTTAYGLVNQGQIFACATPSLLLIGLSATGLFLVELFGWSK